MSTGINRELAFHRNPLMCALACGRQLARLEFFMRQRWLDFPELDSDVNTAFEQLRQAVRGIVSPDNRDQVQQQVSEQARAWASELSSEQLGEQLHDANRDLGGPAGGDLDRNLVVEALLVPVDRRVGQLVERIGQFLDERGRQFLRFGMCIEQGCARRDVADFMLTSHSGWCVDTTSPRNEVPPTMFGRLSVDRSGEFLADRYFRLGELPPPETWLNDVRVRWSELALPREMQELDAVAGLTAADASVIPGIEAALVAALERTAGGNSEIPAPQPPGYLGLIVDQARRCVRREGLSEEVTLTGLPFAVFVLLLRNRDSWTPRQIIRDEWRRTDPRADPEPDTVRSQISDLRGFLRPLGIAIHNRRGQGYRLEDANPQDA